MVTRKKMNPHSPDGILALMTCKCLHDDDDDDAEL